MIIFMGDLHGDYTKLQALNVVLDVRDTVIQVGDFGFYDRSLLYWKPLKFPVYAIDGNHENFNLLRGITTTKEIRDGLYYVPRGTVLEIEGVRIGCMGGGASIDKAYRRVGVDWFPDEVVTTEQVDQFIRANPSGVDVLVTHTPGSRTITGHFTPLNKRYWGLPDNWVDESAINIQRLVDTMPHEKHFCGHMHRSVIDGKTRILDIEEVLVYTPS
jgi:predicted phosphodiesterase